MNEYEKMLAIVADLGYPVSKDFVILDLGCGIGEGVYFFKSQKFSNIIGCDFQESLKKDYFKEKYFVSIRSPYQLPFSDETFDFIYTSQVFEHIDDYRTTLAEMSRILKPTGFSLNIFPPKWRWVEPHVYVPLAGAIQNKLWLTLWAYLGIRNEFQKDLTPLQVAEINHYYLTHNTNYLSTKTIYNLSKQFFDEVRFCELGKFKYSRYSAFYPLSKIIPFFQDYLCNFNMKVLFLRK